MCCTRPHKRIWTASRGATSPTALGRSDSRVNPPRVPKYLVAPRAPSRSCANNHQSATRAHTAMYWGRGRPQRPPARSAADRTAGRPSAPIGRCVDGGRVGGGGWRRSRQRGLPEPPHSSSYLTKTPPPPPTPHLYSTACPCTAPSPVAGRGQGGGGVGGGGSALILSGAL